MTPADDLRRQTLALIERYGPSRTAYALSSAMSGALDAAVYKRLITPAARDAITRAALAGARKGMGIATDLWSAPRSAKAGAA